MHCETSQQLEVQYVLKLSIWRAEFAVFNMLKGEKMWCCEVMKEVSKIKVRL